MKKRVVALILGIFFLPNIGSAYKIDSPNLWTDVYAWLGKNLNIPEWKVGDFANYTMKFGFLTDVSGIRFGEGTVEKSVTKEEGRAVWVLTVAKPPFGEPQKIETLHRKPDGKVLKMIVNGKEEKYEEPEVEILEQRAEEITVPKGTFKTIYIKAKDKTQDADIELWANPLDVPIGGVVKSVIKKIFTITLELTDFGHKDLKK